MTVQMHASDWYGPTILQTCLCPKDIRKIQCDLSGLKGKEKQEAFSSAVEEWLKAWEVKDLSVDWIAPWWDGRREFARQKFDLARIKNASDFFLKRHITGVVAIFAGYRDYRCVTFDWLYKVDAD